MRNWARDTSHFSALSLEPGAAGRRQSEQLVFALALLWLFFLAYPLVSIIGMIARSVPVTYWLLPACGLAILGLLYVWAAWRSSRVAWRHSTWPMIIPLAALAMALPLAFGSDWFGGIIYACIIAGLTLSPRQALGAIVFLLALTLLMGSMLGIIWWEMAALMLLNGLGGSIMLGVAWLQVTIAELQAARAEIARLAAAEERQRLTRDLHDSVKQQVFITAMEIGAARALLERDSHAAAVHLAEANTSIRQAQTELTALIHQSPAMSFAGQSLVAALRTYANDWSRQSGISVETRISGEGPISPEAREALYRVAQEALTNIARHSHATAAGIAFESHDATQTLQVWDNGRGFAPGEPPVGVAGGSGYGLRSMRERIEALGGHLTVESGPEQGTCVTCICTVDGGETTDMADTTGENEKGR